MLIKTKERLAILAMLEIASRAQSSKPVTIATIADVCGASVSYMEQIFARLRRHGLVASVRGPGGGYQLARGADAIHVASIIEALRGRAGEQSAGPQAGSARAAPYVMWGRLSDLLRGFLSTISLMDLMREPPKLGGTGRQGVATRETRAAGL